MTNTNELRSVIKTLQGTISLQRKVIAKQEKLIAKQEKLIEQLRRAKEAAYQNAGVILQEHIVRRLDEVLPDLLKKFRDLDIDEIDIKIINHRAAGNPVKLLFDKDNKKAKIDKRQQKLLRIIGVKGKGTRENWQDLKLWLFNNYLIK